MLVLTLLFYPTILSEKAPLPALLGYTVTGKGLPLRWFISLLIGAVGAALFVSHSTGDIKAKRAVAGDGQFGTARWATPRERSDTYMCVRPHRAMIPGIIIGYSKNHYEVDASDQNLLLLAPPGARKTKGFYIPTIKYNADVNRNTGGKGASMLIIDVKGEELLETGLELKEAGYTVLSLNFRFPLNSYANNQMNNVNEYIDKAKNARDERERIIYHAKAERHAKTLANAIIKVSDTRSNESSEFFNATSEGLIVALVLVNLAICGERFDVFCLIDKSVRMTVINAICLALNKQAFRPEMRKDNTTRWSRIRDAFSKDNTPVREVIPIGKEAKAWNI